MKVLVTGGSGFLGSHVADALTDAGHEVVIYDVKESPYRRQDQTMYQGSVLEEQGIRKAMEDCQVVYHLAAISDIEEASNKPRDTIELNVIGTLNVLESARQERIKRLVFASSIYVYSTMGSFYRTSKQASELLVYDYHERYKLPYTILRFGSLYGPRADMSNAIHNLLNQAVKKRQIDYWGSGREVREYIHVRDAARMSVGILQPDYANEIIHLTGRERMTTAEVLEMICEILGGNITVNLNQEHLAGHYVQTPYSYMPKLGRKMTRDEYVDLGLGLLDCLRELDKSNANEWWQDEVRSS